MKAKNKSRPKTILFRIYVLQYVLYCAELFQDCKNSKIDENNSELKKKLFDFFENFSNQSLIIFIELSPRLKVFHLLH